MNRIMADQREEGVRGERREMGRQVRDGRQREPEKGREGKAQKG